MARERAVIVGCLHGADRAARASRMRGASLLELVAALGVAAIAGGLCGGALSGLSRAIAVEAARVRAAATLLEARRLAYQSSATVEVTAAAGDAVLTIRAPDGEVLVRPLPTGTTVLRSPANGRTRFFASGMADNATWIVGSADAEQEARIVLNQRGLVR